jgi:hypothetical protein
MSLHSDRTEVTELQFRLVGTVPRTQLGSTGFEPLTTQYTKLFTTILHKSKEDVQTYGCIFRFLTHMLHFSFCVLMPPMWLLCVRKRETTRRGWPPLWLQMGAQLRLQLKAPSRFDFTALRTPVASNLLLHDLDCMLQ